MDRCHNLQDGTYKEMQDRWFPNKVNRVPMPDIPLSDRNGILNFGTAVVSRAYGRVYADEGVIGFDIEYAMRIARDLGMELNIVNMEFGATASGFDLGEGGYDWSRFVHWTRNVPKAFPSRL